jgi:hypothetical protein
VYLPDGAVINSITAYVLDNSPTEQIDLRMYSTTFGSTTASLLGIAVTSVSFASATPTPLTLNLGPITVNNSTTTYAIRVVLANEAVPLTKLYGVKVDYTINHVD